MLVELRRTSAGWGQQPDDLARQERRLVTSYCNCETLDAVRAHLGARSWFFRSDTSNHREVEQRGKRLTACDRECDVWLAEIDSLEWAAQRWGTLVVEPSDVVGIGLRVEIYDDYRE